MKRILILVLLMHGCIQCFSQELLQGNKIWSYASIPSIGNNIKTDIYKVQGDTLINEKTYFIIKSTRDSLQVNDWRDVAYLRDEHGKVYSYSNGEYLLYDFNLSEQDSFYVKDIDKHIYLDSIRTNGTLAYMYFSFNEEQTVWIKDIGSLDNLFVSSGNISIVGETCFLLCCEQGGDYLYQNPDYSTCYLSHVGIEKIRESRKIEIYPTIVRDYLYIESEKYPLQLSIIDILGNCYINTTIVSNTQLSCCYLPSGFYMIKIQGINDNCCDVRKIIKQ